MNITDPNVESYIKNKSILKDPILADMEKAAEKSGFPIIGPIAGRLLWQIAELTKAKNILELGSGYGYSAYWFSRALDKNAKIICTDSDETNKAKAIEYFKKSNVECELEFIVGDALDTISKLDSEFDIILNDIDKIRYPEAFDLAIPRLRKGGVFITDNVLWSGRILDDSPDDTTKAILRFNDKLFSSDDVIASIIPIRDGLGMAVKK